MFSSKSVLVALMACAIPAMAETAYMLPVGIESSDKVVISLNAETGAVEFQKADGTWVAGEKIEVPAAQDSLIQKTFWYDDGYGAAGGCACGAVVAPRPYVQGGYYYAQPMYPAVPPTHVRRVHERNVYEYDTGGMPPGPVPPPPGAGPMPVPPVATPYNGYGTDYNNGQPPPGYNPGGLPPQGGYPGY